MRPASRALLIAVAAAVLFVLALLLANAGLPEYSHLVHPVALRGAAGLPWAFAFNLLAFVLPGVLLAIAGVSLRNGLIDRGWPARIGIVLAQLSALAFAAQGLLPLDPTDADSHASRLHVMTWMLWWIAFVPGALLLAVGARRGAGFALGSVAIGALVPIIAVLAPIGLWVGVAQRLAFALWFAWWLLAAWRLTCISASGPGWSTTARR